MTTPAANAVDELCTKLAASLQAGTFVRLILSCPTRADVGLEKILGRLVELKAGPHLSLTHRYATRDEVKNVPVAATAEWLRSQLPAAFASALLGTTKRDWQFSAAKNRLVTHRPAIAQAPARSHDVARQNILDDTARDWLHGLGIVNADGHIRPALADKHAQINRYLEIFTHLAADCGWADKTVAASRLATTETPLTLADMGCGKGYLTFGVWHLFQRVWKRPVRVIGVEARAELVAATNNLARRIGANGLEFRAGTIATAELPALDALIALHACDTATDDALRRGIDLGARLIVVAPCCQHEVRPQLGEPVPLGPVLRHGMFAERMAEWATDGLRMLFLEWAGYRTKAIEFVASEHTPKNLMIAAVRERKPFVDPAMRDQIVNFKTFFGIQRHALDALMTK